MKRVNESQIHVNIHTHPHSSDFGQTVAKEYLRFFEFERTSLENCLRQFLSSFSLTGESQERERIIVHFSDRYFECNPDTFPTSGVCVCLYHDCCCCGVCVFVS